MASRSLNLLGVCQGGVLSLCYAALHPERVRNLITMVTPVDFHTPGGPSVKWVSKIDIAAWVGDGNVPGDALNQLFLSLMPFRLTQQKYVELLRGAPDRAAHRELHARRTVDLRQSRPGGRGVPGIRHMVLSGESIGTQSAGDRARAVVSNRCEMPMLNLIGTQDHLVPPASSAGAETAGGEPGFHHARARPRAHRHVRERPRPARGATRHRSMARIALTPGGRPRPAGPRLTRHPAKEWSIPRRVRS